jgi:hypothetical protein
MLPAHDNINWICTWVKWDFLIRAEFEDFGYPKLGFGDKWQVAGNNIGIITMRFRDRKDSAIEGFRSLSFLSVGET